MTNGSGPSLTPEPPSQVGTVNPHTLNTQHLPGVRALTPMTPLLVWTVMANCITTLAGNGVSFKLSEKQTFSKVLAQQYAWLACMARKAFKDLV